VPPQCLLDVAASPAVLHATLAIHTFGRVSPVSSAPIDDDGDVRVARELVRQELRDVGCITPHDEKVVFPGRRTCHS